MAGPPPKRDTGAHASTIASDDRDVGLSPTLASDVGTVTAPADAEFRRISGDDYVRGPELARGGMGRIVAAHDVRHDRPVAIKELLHQSPAAVARFRREALIAARLQHPAIVPIYEAGRWDDGSPFFAMRHVDGESLDRAIARHEELRDRLALLPHVIAVSEALAYAHARGVIHRDLKPHNVLVGDFGETVVIDWGLAKDLNAAAEAMPAGDAAPGEDAPDQHLHTLPVTGNEMPATGDGNLTVAGAALGTPAYMPPEQARGEEVDARADVYAIGAILYHLLSGIVPYGAARTARELLERVATVAPTPLREFGLEIPEDLVTIVDKAMAREPEDRYPDAGALAGDLRRFAAGQMVQAHRYSSKERLGRWIRGHRVLVASLLVVLGCLVAGLVFYLRAMGAEREETDRARKLAEQERQRAEESLAQARAQTVALLQEQGAARLVAGQPLHAAALLAHAYTLGDRSAALRYTLGAAMPAAESVGLAGRDGALNGAWLTADGQRVLVGEPGALRIHDALTGEEVHTLPGNALPQVALAGDTGRGVVHWGDGRELLFDTRHGKVMAKLPELAGATRVAATPDGEMIFTATVDGTVRAIGKDGTPRWFIRAHEATILALEVSPEGDRIATRDVDGAIHVFRTADGEAVVTSNGTDLAWGPMDQLAVVDARRGVAAIVDVANADQQAFKSAARHAMIAISPRGDRVVTASADGPDIEVWDASSAKRLATLTGHTGAIVALAFDASGDRLISSATDKTARIWDVAHARTIRVLAGQGTPAMRVAFSADGARVLTYSQTSVRVWPIDAAMGASVTDAPGARSVSYGADGEVVLSPDPPRASNTLVPLPGVHDRLSASMDGARIVSMSALETAIWDAPERARLATLEGHMGPVHGAVFTPDAELVLTAGDDGTVRVWEAATGRPLDVLYGHRGPVRAIAMRDDGTQAATLGDDGTLRLWELRLESRPPEVVSQIVSRNVPWRVDDMGRLVAVQ